MKYAIFYEQQAKKEFSKLEKPYQKIIAKKIDKIAQDFNSMTNQITKLKGKLSDYYRLRVGSYRIIFYKDDEKIIITIVRIAHRKEAYKES